MSQPCFRRFWRIFYRDGRIESQFDEDGVYHLWNPSGSIERIKMLPIDEEFAKKIIEKGNLANQIDMPVIDIPVENKVEYHRDCKLRFVPHAVCAFCSAELDQGVEAICPRCFAQNHWYCDICDQFKKYPLIIKEKGWILCPDCYNEKVIRGLMRICSISEFVEEKHEQVHVIVLDNNKKHIILDTRII